MGPEEDLGGWRGGDADTESRAGRNQRGDRPEHGDSQPVVGRGEERDPPRVGAQGSRVLLWPLRLSRGARGLSVEVSTKGERRSLTSMLPPPPPPSVVTSSIRRLRIAAHRTGAVLSVLGKRKAAGLARLLLAARAAVSRCVGGGLVGSGARAER